MQIEQTRPNIGVESQRGRSRRFTMDDQIRFAAVSGDWNPLHVDPLIARRTQFGRPLVHGVHLLMWALETCLEASAPASIVKLVCSFRAPVGLDEPSHCAIVRAADGSLRLSVTSRNVLCVSARVSLGPGRQPSAVIDRNPVRTPCEVVTAQTISTASGKVSADCFAQDTAALFPNLCRLLPQDQLAFLFAATRIVGMKCPGLHSVFSELTMEETPGAENLGSDLVWSVADFDVRFGRASISVAGARAKAVIAAAIRPAPQAQPALADIAKYIAKGAFAGRRALVIGGSRGLGEVCAKLLAAGGADVRFTYHSGAEDAEIVERDIRANGGAVAAFAYDVLSPPDSLAGVLGDWVPTHLYYFATPPIVPGARNAFSHDLFAGFCRYYVEGFYACWSRVRALSKQPIAAFYPSTVYVEDIPPNLGEYAAAKSAGESVCRLIETSDAQTSVLIARLPKLPTDQTLSLLQSDDASDPADVLSGFLCLTAC